MDYKRYLLELDTDSDETTISKTACILRENMRVGSSEVQGQGRNESILGNVLLSNPMLPTGINFTLGSVYEEVAQRAFSFNYNAGGSHGIYYYSFISSQWRALLLNNQVAGGLGFDRNHTVTSKVIGPNLYWNDGFTQPHKLNIQAAIVANNSNNLVYGVVFNENRTPSGVGLSVTFTSVPTGTVSAAAYWRVAGSSVWIQDLLVGFTSTLAVFSPFLTTSAVEYRFEFLNSTGGVTDTVYSTVLGVYTFPLIQSDITLIVRPPVYPLTVTKVTDSSYAQNFTQNEAFQFSLRYVYRTWERSVIDSWSQVVLRNLSTETFNAVDISLPFLERIPQNIAQVELIVRYGNTGKAFVIHTWEAGENAILSHIAGLNKLTYRFYNDQIGAAIGDVAANTPYDFIALRANAMEVAKDRLFLAELLLGYDTPATTSLTAELTQSPSTTTYSAQWITTTVIMRRRSNNALLTMTWYFLYVPSLGLYYNISTYGNLFATVVPPAGLIVPIDNSPYVAGSGPTLATAIPMSNVLYLQYILISVTQTGVLGNAVTATSESLFGSNIARAFKTNSPYRLATHFADEYKRKCGVVLGPTIYTDAKTYSQNVFNQTIKWSLSNTNRLTEIPVWSYYYYIDRTRNLKYAFFLDGRAKDVRYATKDNVGAYQFTATTYASDRNGIAIDISTLEGYGYGYSYQDGDLIELIRTGQTILTLSIIAQYGQWIICSLADIGTVGSGQMPLLEIYTPYKPAETEDFYEVGECFPVNQPGTAQRSYSTLTGFLNGDISIITRSGYFTEAMSPNDKYWKQWETDIGFFNQTDTIGQQFRATEGTFSATYIDGTKTNGLSTFYALNVFSLPVECGGVTNLQLASKVQADGTVMLAIGKYQTASMYLGEVQQTDNEGNTTIVISRNVVGSIQVLKGSRGCLNAESVGQVEGDIYWIDVLNGKAVRYGANGLFDISDFRCTRFWRLFGKDYQKTGNKPFIAFGYDPRHMEAVWSLPQTVAATTILPDVNIPFPYDAYDGKAKTIVFRVDDNIWTGAYLIQQDNFITVSGQLYSFNNGQLYRHNEGNTLNGAAYQAKVSFIEPAQSPSTVKVWQRVAVESPQKPVYAHFRSEQPFVQSTDLVAADFDDQEGVQYATLFRDRLTPSFNNQYLVALYNGEEMRTKALRVHLVFDTPCSLNFVNTGFEVSKGHTI